MEAAVGEPTATIDVDRLSFAVRAQKFRIGASVMKRTSIPLTTEYATRLVHLVRGITPEELAGFFDFDEPETRILLQELLSSGLVEDLGGHLRLSQRGQSALSPIDDTLNIFDLDEITAVVSFDLISFSPVADAELADRERRLVEELPIADRSKAANSELAARDAYDLHFHEWRVSQSPRMGLDEDSRLHAVGEAHVVRNFAAPIEVPVRYRIDDGLGATADFAELSAKGRTGSRDRLIDALSKRLQRVTGAPDHQAAYDLVSDCDGGIFRRDGMRSATEPGLWAELASDPARREFSGWMAPGLRLVGSTSTAAVRASLLEWTKGITDRSKTRSPVFWLPPDLPHWGRSVSFASLAAALSEANSSDDGTVLLPRVDGSDFMNVSLRRYYGRTERIDALFDRCLPLQRPAVPGALEVILKPQSWAMVLIHASDVHTGLPFPVGYITAAQGLVARFAHILAELASQTKGPSALLWHMADETQDKALLVIDQALGIVLDED
jgi:hypothetical protein